VLIAVLLVSGASPWAAGAQARKSAAPIPPDVAVTGARQDRVQIEAALRKVRADPSLGADRVVHMLRWQSSPKSTSMDLPDWLKWLRPLLEGITAVFGWIAGAATWLAESGRAVLWVAALILVGLLAVYLLRFLKVQGMPRTEGGFTAPSFVRDLDIRPESLPDDIGATARLLWARGDHRGALALLYRGLLSRLVHVHGVPVRDSSTEGDCLALTQRLDAAQRDYAALLIRSWQLAVYGGRALEDAAVMHLCAQFSAALDRPPPDAGGLHAAAQGA
jgi:hypothetical protein